jgi:hypothetical protein
MGGYVPFSPRIDFSSVRKTPERGSRVVWQPSRQGPRHAGGEPQVQHARGAVALPT